MAEILLLHSHNISDYFTQETKSVDATKNYSFDRKNDDFIFKGQGRRLITYFVLFPVQILS